MSVSIYQKEFDDIEKSLENLEEKYIGGEARMK